MQQSRLQYKQSKKPIKMQLSIRGQVIHRAYQSMYVPWPLGSKSSQSHSSGGLLKYVTKDNLKKGFWWSTLEVHIIFHLNSVSTLFLGQVNQMVIYTCCAALVGAHFDFHGNLFNLENLFKWLSSTNSTSTLFLICYSPWSNQSHISLGVVLGFHPRVYFPI